MSSKNLRISDSNDRKPACENHVFPAITAIKFGIQHENKISFKTAIYISKTI